MQNLSHNELKQITKMQNLSQNEFEQIARTDTQKHVKGRINNSSFKIKGKP